MKRKNLLLVLLTLCSFILAGLKQRAYGSHAMGADLTYECLGGNQYRLRFSFYRDCSGIDAPTSILAQYYSSCFPGPFDATLLPVTTIPNQISPVCPTQISTCEGGTYTGIEEWIYEATITLPGTCADWIFTHNECCRNSAITTISNPGSENLVVYSQLDNTNGICNNSPTFSNNPVPFACVGQRFCFNHGAFDVDGDSLSYQLITPLTSISLGGTTSTVTYGTGYSNLQPVISSPPATFNTSTGDICMTPAQQDVTVFAVLVNEYRNGVLIGQVERDIQLTVLNCNNFLPTLTGINGSPSFNRAICADQPFNFYIASVDANAINNTTINWDFGIPGATLTTTGGRRDSAYFSWTPTVADIGGPYCFTATVADDNCPYLGTQIYSYCFTVRGVEANAGPDQSISCGATANLSGSATGGSGSYTYTWNPGNITGQNFNGAGIGQYVLTVNDGTCSNTDTVSIIPGSGVPVAGFNFTNNCSGAPIQFSDQTVVGGGTISSWSWDFGDGATSNQQNPQHQYATFGTYLVTLIVQTPAGCVDTVQQQVVLNIDIPTAQFASASVCQGAPVSFTDLSLGSPNAWSWNFGDPGSTNNTAAVQNPSHTFSGGGSYIVTLTVTNAAGCSATIQNNVIVNPLPVAAFSSPASACRNSVISFTDNSIVSSGSVSSWSWNFNNGQTSSSQNPTSSYNVDGNFQVELIVSSDAGCLDTVVNAITINPLPVAIAGPDEDICSGFNVNLTGSGGLTYSWSPGGLSGASIIVAPVTTTDYELIVTDANGCTAADIVRVNVRPVPAANAGADQSICIGESTTLSASGGDTYVWFNSGGVVVQNWTITPLTTAVYEVEVANAFGCKDTDQVEVRVNPLPVAAFGNTAPVCQLNSISFDDQSSVTSGTVDAWSWDFGNGLSSTNQDVQVPYQDPGDYTVTLVITTDAGCRDTISQPVRVNAKPVAGFNHTDVCDGLPILFESTSSISDATPISLSWNLGDNTTSSDLSISHLYAGYGAYPVTLLVTSTAGCADSIQRIANVFALPDAAFTVPYACEDDAVAFADGSIIPDGFISDWYWTFGDGAVSAESNPAHVYLEEGSYAIRLLVTSNNGCQDSVDGAIRVVPAPLADFSAENVCLGFETNLTSLAQPSTGPIISYEWNLGDGSISSEENPVHIYPNPGWYTVSLTVRSDSGCASTLVRPNALNVFDPPVAAFTTNSSEASDIYPMVNFTNQTSSPGFFFWDFGDSTTSTEYSPLHIYKEIGIYDIRLIAIDEAGCVDTTFQRIELRPTSTLYVPNSFTPNGDLRNDVFKAYSYNVLRLEAAIYDRWGLKIYEWNTLDGGWDGKVNGSPAQADTYVYRIALVDVNDKRDVVVGQVNLVR